jgi:hypothetical protein
MSGPFELIGDPEAPACEGDFCALPAEPEDADDEDAVPQD